MINVQNRKRHPVGNISNALMTAKRLLGERIAAYSAKGLNYKDRLLEGLQKIGIQLIGKRISMK